MAEIKWIKILITIFGDEKIKLIKSMPEGRTLVLIWMQLLAQAGKTNAGGWVFMNEETPFSLQNLAILFDESQQMVEIALKLFASKGFEMIEIDPFGRIYIPNWEKHQAVDKLDKIREDTKIRVANHREKKKLKAINGNVTPALQVTGGNAIELELELELDKEKDIKNKTLVIFDDFWDIYPRKLRKQDAEKAWIKILKDKAKPVIPSEIIVSVQNYAAECIRKETNVDYIMHPPTFLNKGRWRDYLIVPGGDDINGPKQGEEVGFCEPGGHGKRSSNKSTNGTGKKKSKGITDDDFDEFGIGH